MSPWQAIKNVAGRSRLRVLLGVDFIYWMSFAVYQTTFALFGAIRFGFDVAETGYLLSAFGFLGVIVQGLLVGPIVTRLGERRTLTVGLLLTAIGWGGSALTYSLPVFIALLVPGAIAAPPMDLWVAATLRTSTGTSRVSPTQEANM